jgi:dTDP-4-amino-4,6-dideoxygalactose transaminase
MSTNRLQPLDQLQVPFVDLAAQYFSIAPEIEQAMGEVLRQADFILGREVQRFEEEFAAFCGARYAVGVDSGTSAIELALRAYEIKNGDEVISAANSFIATALAISHTGATPVLVDVDSRTYTIDVAAVERAITPRTKAIIPVHLYGHPASMDLIRQLAERHRLIVIEDACQAHGAIYQKRRVGSWGNTAAFSFYPGKNLGAYGDGGIVVTDDRQIAERILMLRNYGQREKHHHMFRGYNRRLDTLQAAVLRVKLKHLDAWNESRRRNATLYSTLLQGSGALLPCEAEGATSVWHLYVIRIRHRDALQGHLAKRGISTAIHYPIPIHLQPAYQDLGYKNGDFPVAEACAETTLSLPMYAELMETQIELVAKEIHQFTNAQRDAPSGTPPAAEQVIAI